jgi:hypothetical protein
VIFKQRMVDAILAGEKTVTRRPVKYDDAGRPIPQRYFQGSDYAIQPVIEDGPGKGRGGKEVGRIEIVSTAIEQLHEITDNEARLEGFTDVSAFADYWRLLYGRWDGTQLIRRYQFKRISPKSGGGGA